MHPSQTIAAQRRAAQVAEAVGLDRFEFDRAAVADAVGLAADETVQWWRAMGIVEVPDGVVAFSGLDLEMARQLAELLAENEAHRSDVLRMARLLGGSFSRIAEAQVQVLEETLAEELPAEALATPARRSEVLLGGEGRRLIEVFEQSVLYVWRRHLFAALGRWVGAEDDQTVQAVGFADISRFSAISKRVNPAELTEIVDTFERESVDVVTHRDGRVVKFIGDEVLFVVDSVSGAVDIALELTERMAAAPVAVPLHCGIAHGPTITIGGDVFGETVNLAKRLTAVARRGKVVLTKASSADLGDRDDLQLHRVARVFELKGIGRTQIVSVTRRAVEPPGGLQAVGTGVRS